MKAVFLETSTFSASLARLLPDGAYATLQQQLLANPAMGATIKNCGGLRKIRWADSDRNKGKRGGLRLVYLHVPEAQRFYMLSIYGKQVKEDLSAAERKALATLAGQLRREAAAQTKGRPT